MGGHHRKHSSHAPFAADAVQRHTGPLSLFRIFPLRLGTALATVDRKGGCGYGGRRVVKPWRLKAVHTVGGTLGVLSTGD